MAGEREMGDGGPSVVTLCKRKRPQGWARWRAHVVAEDEHGTWVFTPAGSTYLGDDERGTRKVVPSARGADGQGNDLLVLLPRGGWWVAQLVFGTRLVCSVDVSTPPLLDGAEWAYTDLELDPVLLADGTVFVEDEDELEEAYAAGLVTDAERSEAEAAAAWWVGRLTSPSTFIALARTHFERARSRGLEPLAAPDHPS